MIPNFTKKSENWNDTDLFRMMVNFCILTIINGVRSVNRSETLVSSYLKHIGNSFGITIGKKVIKDRKI